MSRTQAPISGRARWLLAGLLAGACSTDPGVGPAANGNGNGASGGDNAGGPGSNGDGGFTLKIPDGGAAGSATDDGQKCGITATIRDFKDTHPDFEHFNGALKGIVTKDLGPDNKPVYAAAGPTAVTSGKDAFDQWYRDVPDINIKFLIPLPLTAMGGGTYVYDNSAFFPLDNQGFGNQGRAHNFHFTTEIHATFKYAGGEKFTFRGDDDVWIFINKKLALDLGGVHGAQMDTVDFDAQAGALGITVGSTYAFDAFHAERHTSASNFRMETSIACLKSID